MLKGAELAGANDLKPVARRDPEGESAVALILAIGRSFKHIDDQIRPRMAKMGLSMTEFSVLNTLYYRGPTPLGELSDRILLTGASTTYTVKKLEKRGLMTRLRSEQDQRVTYGKITQNGRKLLRQIFPLHAKDLVAAMQALTIEEKRTATRLLKKLQDSSFSEHA